MKPCQMFNFKLSQWNVIQQITFLVSRPKLWIQSKLVWPWKEAAAAAALRFFVAAAAYCCLVSHLEKKRNKSVNCGFYCEAATMYGPVSAGDRWGDTRLSWFRKFLWNVSWVHGATGDKRLEEARRPIGFIHFSLLSADRGGASLSSLTPSLPPSSPLQAISFTSTLPSFNSCLLLHHSSSAPVCLHPPLVTPFLFFSSFLFFSHSHPKPLDLFSLCFWFLPPSPFICLYRCCKMQYR